MGLFGAANGQGHPYPTKMKLGTAIPYLNKTPKIYESFDISPEFC